MGTNMSKPILAKENHQLIDQLEEDILKLLKKFNQDTGLLVTTINTIIAEHYTGSDELVGVRIRRIVKG